MLTLVLIKSVADLSFYYTFAGYVALVFGASSGFLMMTAFIQAVAVTLSFFLREKGALRFAPALIMALPLLLPGASAIAGLIAIAPATLYCIYVMAQQRYMPDWDKQAGIFSLFWKVMIPYTVLSLVTGNKDIYTAVGIPFAVMMFVLSVLIMRSMRHEEEVYCQPAYQLTNCGIVLAVGGSAALMSSKAFLGIVLGVLKFIYDLVIGPILMLVAGMFAVFAYGFEWLMSLFVPDLSGEEKHDLLKNFNEMDLWKGLQEETGPAKFPARNVVIAVGVIIAVVLIIYIFRKMSARGEKSMGLPGRKETRAYAASVEPEEEPAPGSPVAKIRGYYKKFLKFATKYVGAPLLSDTSRDFSERCEGSFTQESVFDLRDIYIAARYNGKATKEDAKRAKELVSSIEKSAMKVKD